MSIKISRTSVHFLDPLKLGENFTDEQLFRASQIFAARVVDKAKKMGLGPLESLELVGISRPGWHVIELVISAELAYQYQKLDS